MTDIFWKIATSFAALGLDGVVLLAALVVGYLPLLNLVPGVGKYVPVARLVAVLVAALMCFLLGFRISDEREVAKNLRATIAAQKADLENATKSAADASKRATEIETSATAQHDTDQEYIRSLAALPACALGDGDIPGGLRQRPSVRSVPLPSIFTRSPDEARTGPGALQGPGRARGAAPDRNGAH